MEGITTLLAVLIGGAITWGTNELTHRSRQKREDARLLSEIVYDLLNIRWAIIKTHRAIKETKKQTPVSPEAEQRLWNSHFKESDVENLISSYKLSLRKAAGFDPALAFELQSASDMLRSFFELREGTLLYPQIVEKIHEYIMTIYAPNLDKMIIRVGGKLSSKAHRDIEKILARPTEIPNEAKETLSNMLKPES